MHACVSFYHSTYLTMPNIPNKLHLATQALYYFQFNDSNDFDPNFHVKYSGIGNNFSFVLTNFFCPSSIWETVQRDTGECVCYFHCARELIVSDKITPSKSELQTCL